MRPNLKQNTNREILQIREKATGTEGNLSKEIRAIRVIRGLKHLSFRVFRVFRGFSLVISG